MLASTFGSGQVLWSMLWFFMFVIWIWVLIAIFGDIFRSDDMSGGLKAFWIIFVVILPWLGILIYLIARGGGMQKRAIAHAQQQQAEFQQYVQADGGQRLGRRSDRQAGRPQVPGRHHRRRVRGPEGQAARLSSGRARPVPQRWPLAAR